MLEGASLPPVLPLSYTPISPSSPSLLPTSISSSSINSQPSTSSLLPFPSSQLANPEDPTASWELHRLDWLNRRLPEEERIKLNNDKDPIFVVKLRELELLLNSNGSNSNGSLSSNSTLLSNRNLKGKGRLTFGEVEAEGEGEEDDEIEEIDGGEVIRKKNDRIGEGILNHFRQGKTLKNSVPLSIVTKLLYASWLQDGTIPKDYLATNSSGPSTPINQIPQPLAFNQSLNYSPSSNNPDDQSNTIKSTILLNSPKKSTTSNSPRVFGRESLLRLNSSGKKQKS